MMPKVDTSPRRGSRHVLDPGHTVKELENHICVPPSCPRACQMRIGRQIIAIQYARTAELGYPFCSLLRSQRHTYLSREPEKMVHNV